MAGLAGKSLDELCVFGKDLSVSVSEFAGLVAKPKRAGGRSDAAYAMWAAAEEIRELGEVATLIADKLTAAGEDEGCQLRARTSLRAVGKHHCLSAHGLQPYADAAH